MRRLGVGLVYWPELAPVVAAGGEIISVLEIEPQTLWEKAFIDGRGAYRINEEAFSRIEAMPHVKLIHGVGHPVGGLTDDPLDWRTPFARCVNMLNPPWVSEHLSFNRFSTPEGIRESSFLLPPRQTPAGVMVAAENLRRMQKIVGRPVAFETGVNYLQRRPDEMSDGEYFAAVAAAAECGILLDLHNLWANERNGRQPLTEILDVLPLERVWEVHVAGGMPLNGYWLDAHCGLVDDGLMRLVEQTLSRLPNLSALVFEILPQYVAGIGLDCIHRQMESLSALWRRRPPVEVAVSPAQSGEMFHRAEKGIGDMLAWEQSLAAIALGWPRPTTGLSDLVEDSGGAVFEQLVHEFRSGRVARGLRYSMLTLFRYLGAQAVDGLVRVYCRTEPADIFTAVEAERFAAFLQRRIEDGRLCVPFLSEVLAFERAIIRASLYGAGTHLQWTVDPSALFSALETGGRIDLLARTSVPMVVQV